MNQLTIDGLQIKLTFHLSHSSSNTHELSG